ncbi:thioesterase domain-containing protein [Aliikangiella sp. G2MR2-5]|uniref:lipase family protein n=1 Tax=Aliikangiella sp. G2MR2-5 TaxID=2788943 RepID=UPI0018AA2F67|nr:thioesterase domain-containing protein [Aliikangiella sp. G2MR2-5]
MRAIIATIFLLVFLYWPIPSHSTMLQSEESPKLSNLLTRDEFISRLSMESCEKSPDRIYIDTNNSDFDLAHAYSFSWLALQTLDVITGSFEDDPDADLIKAEEQWNLKDIKMIESKPWQVKAMIAEYQDVVLLTFRHTDSNLNWLFNADYGLWNFEHSFTLGQKVHHGFGSMLGAIWEETTSEIRSRTAYSDKPVYVFGHSLGGAMALLAAAGLSVEGVRLAQVYVTGVPKVAGRDWQIQAESQLNAVPIYRVTNSQDLFARVPVSNYALDEFREMFSFVPDFLANLIGNTRSQMEFGVIGEHALMTDSHQLVKSSAMDSELNEPLYWLNLAEQFSNIDQNATNIFENITQKFAILSENLKRHLMRKPENGYTCSMIQLLKSESK